MTFSPGITSSPALRPSRSIPPKGAKEHIYKLLGTAVNLYKSMFA